MKWFSGTVETAIQISRKNNALLVVFISTSDEKGRQLSELWDDVDTSILPCPVVGIQLKKGDQAATQFSEIYPTPILPASYLIDLKGNPIEIITHLIELNNDSFRSRLNRAIAEFTKANPHSVVSVQQNQAPAQIGSSNSNASAPAPPVSPSLISAPAPAQSSSPPQAQTQAQDSAEDASAKAALEEKVRRAKELLEQKRKRDEEMKKAEDKEKELTRIKETKTMQEAKKDREDKEVREAAAQRKKDKLEADKERERVRAQIRADREDAEYRRKRDQQVAGSTDKSENVAEKKETETLKAVPSDRCRVQVRLPSGSTIVEEFTSGENLLSLVEIIKQKGNINGSFQLSQFYPRRTFDDEELKKSFLENALTPSCVLLVLQAKSTSILPQSGAGGLFSILSLLLLTPFNFIWGLIGSFFGSGSAANKKPVGGSSVGSSGSGAGDSRGDDESEMRQRGIPRGAQVRRRGNVAGLHNPNGNESEEEEARWNGNSTKFL